MIHQDDGKLVLWIKGVGGFLAIITTAVAIHLAYVSYHTRHVMSILDPMMGVHTAEMELRIATTQYTADETQRKVDALSNQISSLQVSSSIAAVSALQTELDRHERTPEEGESWVREKDKLKRQIEQALQYRQCLIDQKKNCDLLRGW